VVHPAPGEDVGAKNGRDLGPEIRVERIDGKNVDRAAGLEQRPDVAGEKRAGSAGKLVGENGEAQAELRVVSESRIRSISNVCESRATAFRLGRHGARGIHARVFDT
jgi:hypothetical protein